MDSKAQHSKKLRPFDPSEHGVDVAQSFEKIIRLYQRKYIAWDRSPPASTENRNQWKSKDKLRQLQLIVSIVYVTDTNLILTKPCHIANPIDFNNQQASRLALLLML